MDDSVELQPGSPSENDVAMDTATDISSDSDNTKANIGSSDKVFDISEDNIAEVKDTASASMQVFPIKKVTPSKNLFDPSYSKSYKPENPTPPPTAKLPTTPFAPKTENNPPVTNASKFATEKLPEIPAFKGTFDQKAASFTPTSFVKKGEQNTPPITPVTPPISTPTPVPVTPPVTKPSVSTPTPPVTQPTSVSPASETNTPKPPTFSTSVVSKPEIASTPKPSAPSKNLLEDTPAITPLPPIEKSIGSIPLKDITTPKWSSRQTSPANPPTKTLGTVPIPSTENKFDLPENPELKRLRTYESDVAEIMANKGISRASIAIAENKKAEEEAQIQQQVPVEQNQPQTENYRKSEPSVSKHNVSKGILIFISLTFIIVGIGGAYYLYSKSVFGPRSSILGIPVGPSGTNIIPADSKTTLNISSMDPNAIVAVIRREWEKTQNPDSIHELIITDGENRVTGPRMVEFMDIDAPDILKRSLTDDWMLGIHTDISGNKDLFVIATTNFFQNAFAGMFQWESVMADDLKLFLSSGMFQGIVNAPVATSTITVSGTNVSVPTSKQPTIGDSVDPYFTLRGQFEDRIIMNKDVRVFRTSQGKILFFYSFVDNATIVIASREQTLTKILDRLEKKAFVR